MAREGLSRGDLLLLIVVLAVFGIVDSLYLTWQWYEAASGSWCDIGSYFSCTRVRESAYSAVGGVPTAVIGAVGFAILLFLATARVRGLEHIGPWSTERWLLLFSSVGAFVGAGLSAIEVLVIQAVCVLCVLGFGLDLAILAVGLLWLR